MGAGMGVPGTGGAGIGGAGGPEGPRPNGTERRRRSMLFAASLVVTALVAAGAGVGITLAVTNRSSGGPVSLGTGPSPTPSAPAGQGLDVAAIAVRVEAATVDITATGPGQPDEGTGMILTSSGLVLTNNHVVAGSTRLKAQVNGKGKSYPVTVVGTDATDDVALLQVRNGGGFKSVTLGNSDAVTVGEQVVAIGNALALTGPETVTNGIISATQRAISVTDPATGLTENLKGLFQTSAPINPGNSGGPLVDAAGRVIGMNTAAASGTGSGTANDVGFAIPINSAMSIARQIEAGHGSATVQIGPHAIMGVVVTSVACAEGQDGCTALGSSPSGSSPFGSTSPYTAPVAKGAVIEAVEAGYPAAAAGLAPGDVITSVDGKPVSSPEDLTVQLRGRKVGTRVTIGWVGPTGGARSTRLRLAQGPAL